MAIRTAAQWERVAKFLLFKPESLKDFPTEFQSALHQCLEVQSDKKVHVVSVLEAQFRGLENKLQQRCTGYLNRQRKAHLHDNQYDVFGELLGELKTIASLDELSDAQAIRLALTMTINFFDKNVLSLQNTYRAELDEEEYVVVASSEDHSPTLDGLSQDGFIGLDIVQKIEILQVNGLFKLLAPKAQSALAQLDAGINEWVETAPEHFSQVPEQRSEFDFEE